MMNWQEFREQVWELVDKLNFQEKQLENFDNFENALKAKKKDSDVWDDFECKFWDVNVGSYQNIFFSRKTLELLIVEEKAQVKEEIRSIERKLAALTHNKAFERYKGQTDEPETVQ